MTSPSKTPDDRVEEPPLLGSFPAGSGPDRVLRDALKALRDAAPDERTAALYDDVLSGRRPARELLNDPVFHDSAMAGIRRVREQRALLTPEEQARGNAEASAFLERGR